MRSAALHHIQIQTCTALKKAARITVKACCRDKDKETEVCILKLTCHLPEQKRPCRGTRSRTLWDAHPAMEMQLLSCLRAQGWIYLLDKTALHTRHRCFVLLLNTPLTFLFNRPLFDFPLFVFSAKSHKTFAEKLKDSLKEDKRERQNQKYSTLTLQKQLLNLKRHKQTGRKSNRSRSSLTHTLLHTLICISSYLISLHLHHSS